MESTSSPPFRRTSVDTHNYGWARSGRRKHRSPSRDGRIQYIIAEYENLARSQPVDGFIDSSSRSHPFPETVHHKNSMYNPPLHAGISKHTRKAYSRGYSRGYRRARSRASSSGESSFDDAHTKWELERMKAELAAMRTANEQKKQRLIQEKYHEEEIELIKAREKLAQIRFEEERSRSAHGTAGVEKKLFDAVHDPSLSSKDISIRLDVPIEQDLGPDLEDFCRFRRLGRFKEARDLYQLKLAQHSTIPYVFVQYAEMLIVSGDYKSFQELTYPEQDEGKQRSATAEDKLRTNYELLKLLTRSPVWRYTSEALETVRGVLEELKDEQIMGSTEVQLLSICFQILSYFKATSHHHVVAQAIQDAKKTTSLDLLYCHLLGEARIWDFRDLLTSAASVFGWPETISMLFNSKNSTVALARIHKDWSQLGDGESIILGLLDIFTSLMLQSRPLDKAVWPPSLSLAEHARVLADSAQKENPDNLNTRPFIQWILAKTLWETRPAPKRRPDGVMMEDFQGLLLDQGDDLHLPVFVPVNSSEKPDWGMVAARPSASHRSAVEVALGAAMQADDFHLQALALKALCLQSQDPTRFMDVLSTLQLDLQGDMEGYLGTCLARYLAPQGSSEADERGLLRRFKQLDNASGTPYLHSGVNPSLLWARDVIQGHILTKIGHGQGQIPGWERNLRIYGPTLPQYIANFIEDHFGLTIRSLPRVSFNIIGNKNAQQENGVRSVSRTESTKVLSQQWTKPDPPATTYKPQGVDTSTKRPTPQIMPLRRSTDDWPRRSLSRERTPSRVRSPSRARSLTRALPSSRVRSPSRVRTSSHVRSPSRERVGRRGSSSSSDYGSELERARREPQRIRREDRREDRRKPRSEMFYPSHNRDHDVGPERFHRSSADDRYGDYGYSAKIPKGVKVDNHLSELSFSSRLLKDNTVTVVVRNKDNPEQAASYQMNSTGVFDITPGGAKDHRRREVQYDHTTLFEKPVVSEIVDRRCSDEEDADIRVYRAPPPGPHHDHFVHVGTTSPSDTESTLSTSVDVYPRPQSPPNMNGFPPARLLSPVRRRRGRSPTYIPSVSRSDFGESATRPAYKQESTFPRVREVSPPKPPGKAQRNNRGHDAGDLRWNRRNTNEADAVKGKHPATAPTIRHKKQHLTKGRPKSQNMSARGTGKTDSKPEYLAREKKKKKRAGRTKSSGAQHAEDSSDDQVSSSSGILVEEVTDTKTEAELKPELLDSLPDKFGGQPDNSHNGPELGNSNESPDLPESHREMADPIPDRPIRRSTVENADDEEGWHHHVAAREGKVQSTKSMTKIEEVTTEGGAQANGNPTSSSQNPLENTEGYYHDDPDKKMSEKIREAKEHMDQPNDSF